MFRGGNPSEGVKKLRGSPRSNRSLASEEKIVDKISDLY